MTSDRILRTSLAKAEAWDLAGCPETAVVDTESAIWALAANARGLPWAILRAVSDTAGEGLPIDFDRFRDSSGGVNRGRLVRHVLLRPGLMKKFAPLRRRARLCARRLADVLEEALSS